jgi:hypothetical protein
MGKMADLDAALTEPETWTNELSTLPKIMQDEILRINAENLAASVARKKLEKPHELGILTALPENLLEVIRKGDNSEFEEAVQQKFQHAKAVLLQKHLDYGPKNIAGAPGGALNGIRVRIWDKIARINHLAQTGARPENESLKDSFLDLANYAIIAMLVLDNEWPNE